MMRSHFFLSFKLRESNSIKLSRPNLGAHGHSSCAIQMAIWSSSRAEASRATSARQVGSGRVGCARAETWAVQISRCLHHVSAAQQSTDCAMQKSGAEVPLCVKARDAI